MFCIMAEDLPQDLGAIIRLGENETPIAYLRASERRLGVSVRQNI